MEEGLDPQRLVDNLAKLEKLDWRGCEASRTLDDLKNVEAVQLLRNGLMELGYKSCSVGLNAGTTFVSFTLKFTGSRTPVFPPTSPLGEVLAVMLCCNRSLVELEEAWQGPDLLTNYCIEKFSNITGVALCHVTWKKRTKNLRAVFCSEKTVKDRLSGKVLWRYSPCYTHFFTFAVAEGPPIYNGDAGSSIARLVVNDLWESVSQAHFIIDQNLKPQLDAELHSFILEGLVGPGEAFKPSSILSRRLKFYLWGGAGTMFFFTLRCNLVYSLTYKGVGKSTFVGLLGKAIEKAFQKYINPDMQVNIVKVPLNSVSPVHLQHILRIQGISDWSVERMVEQSVAKDNLAILHLEENPADFHMQQRMFSLVDSMLSHLLQKYPERVGCVVYAITSNYLPCPEIAKMSKLVVNVHPPNADDQFAWAKSMLQDRVDSTLGGGHGVVLDIPDEVRPPSSNDMRPLNNWWLSLGFYATTLPLDNDNKVVSIRRENEHTISMNGVLLQTSDSYFYTALEHTPLSSLVHMSVRGYTTPSVIFLDYSGGQVAADKLEANQTEHVDIVAETCGSLNAHVRWLDAGLLQEEDDKVKIYGDASQIRGGLYEFIDDTNNPHVKPKRTCGDCVVCGKDIVCSAAVEDVGKESPVRVALVTATLNGNGQFMLRELLETSERSRTHRFSISKMHLIFLLSVLPGHPLTPQARSRAHFIKDMTV